MRKHKILIVLNLSAVILTIIALFLIRQRYQITVVDIPKFDHQTITASTSTPAQNSLLPTTYKLPATLLLPVPFTPQAPTGNWDQLHNEACEEASAIMVAEYFSGNKNTQLDPELVEGQISKLTAWEQNNLGYYLDTTSAETAQMIQSVYGLNTKLVNNFTASDIKSELSQDHIVLISEYGRALRNPNYKQPGPIHHMLVIRGYDGDNFITNDSGTRNGREYIYTFDVLHNAAADWSHSTNNVDLNRKIVIVVWK